MKIIMYHCVREALKDLPYFRYLHFENFKKQLDFFEKKYGFVSYDELLHLKENPLFLNKLKNKILLTFDDGFKDHYTYVFDELVKRKLFGIFFIPTRVFEQEKALDVHRIHYLLGKNGGDCLKFTQKLLKPYHVKKSYLKLFKGYYEELDDDKNTREFKLLFNYLIKPKYKEKILDKLVANFCNDAEIFKGLYLDKEDLKTMSEYGMILAAHGHKHFDFKTLSKQEQKQELQRSIKLIDSFISQNIKVFCYPYGEETCYAKRWLKKHGFDFAFSAIPSKNTTYKELSHKRFALRRYDCNEFAHGRASFG